jgi:pimeloyl-ACP methyl ester carboxylesterase/predicted glycosyltransferase
MRAEEPAIEGVVTRDGVRIGYEVFGPETGPVLVLLPCWIIVHARSWKAQVADFARDMRVVVVDGRGNGRSDRPAGPDAYRYGEYVADALAVIDHLGLARYSLVGFSRGGPQAALIAAQRPEQVQSVVLIATVAPMSAREREARIQAFTTARDSYEGWERYNAHYILEDVDGFVRLFFQRMFVEPHSTKQIEDAIGWAAETTPQVLVDSMLGGMCDEVDLAAAFGAISCPVLQIHGEADEIATLAGARKVAQLTGVEPLVFEGSGHGPHMRYPVRANTAIRDFLTRQGVLAPRAPRRRRAGHTPSVLFISSPIGLGHARRDLAIVRALRELRPGASVDWLAQDPVTRLLDSAGEAVHPASAALASESRHIEDEAGEHDLHVFQALRRMDEILVRNFRVFQEVVETGAYDLVVADEGWEVDHFWHEHPELKRTQLAWLTDFVGFAPMPDGGSAEARLTADYNAEMIHHVDSHRGVRDRAVYVGNLAEVVDDALGPDLPGRREWTAGRFDCSGYILGDDVPRPEDRAALRAELGFGEGEEVCVVTVGGSGVGRALIRRILAAVPLARRRRPWLRTIVVAGPRLSTDFAPIEGVEFRGYEPRLPQLLAACDLALVQGGLSTCMELAATRTPFIYFPLEHHFEQNIHVAARLDAYEAGRRFRYADAEPDALAQAIVEELERPVAWARVERDGAGRAAALIADLL